MYRKTMIYSLVTTFFLLTATVSMAYCGEFLQVIRTDEGVTFVSGGVSIDERKEMKKLVKDYNLKLVFAELKGNYLSGIDVIIQDVSGNRIIGAKTEGPWLYAKLPSGDYMITSVCKEIKKVKTITVNQDITTVIFHWEKE